MKRERKWFVVEKRTVSGLFTVAVSVYKAYIGIMFAIWSFQSAYAYDFMYDNSKIVAILKILGTFLFYLATFCL